MPPKSKIEMLANIKMYRCGTINIETFNPKTNSWSIVVDTRFRQKSLSHSSIVNIVIDYKLFIVGGYDYVNKIFSNRVHYYHLYTTEWLELPPMKKGRCAEIESVVSVKGYLCVFGGDNDKMGDPITMEIFNFATNTWHDLESPYKPYNINQHIAGDSKILYFNDSANGVLQSYDPALKEWTLREIEKYQLKGYGFAAVNGFLYIIGGFETNPNNPVTTVKRYNVSNASWRDMASLPYACLPSQTIVLKNKIYIRARAKLFEYTLNTNKWKSLFPLTLDNDFEFMLGTCCDITDDYEK